MDKKDPVSVVIKLLLAISIVGAILFIFYVKIIEKDYEIFYNEDGMPIIEE